MFSPSRDALFFTSHLSADDQDQVKRTAEQQAQEKAKRQEALARRREQASKAANVNRTANIDPLMAPTQFTSRGNPIAPVSLNPDSAVGTSH